MIRKCRLLIWSAFYIQDRRCLQTVCKEHSTQRSSATVLLPSPSTWLDNLPVDLRLCRTFSTFKTHLKSHLFNIFFPSIWLYHWLFLYRALEDACAAYAYLNLSLFHYITLHWNFGTSCMPRAWNKLPPPLRCVSSPAALKRQLKTFFYTITLLIHIVRRPCCVSALTSP